MAYEAIIDSKELTTLHNLMIDNLITTIEMVDPNTESGKEMLPLIAGWITTYVPVYMGNRMLFWSGQYWEESHPIISQRIKSKDLVNTDLENGLKQICVFPP